METGKQGGREAWRLDLLYLRKKNSGVMENEVRTCSKCILHDKIDGVVIDDDGICNHCKDYKPFVPFGEDKLLKIFDKARKKHRIYDALVPLSGGKDSTYVLYLAVKKYGLNVLTYTFDNSFMSDFAIKNIESTVRECGVDHIWVKHDEAMIRELYSTTLRQSGEICGICGIGIENSTLKISEAWKIPLILMGHSPAEANSSTGENIYDQARLKAILRTNRNISEEMIKRFFIYPDLNFLSSYIYARTGRFGKKVNILYYLDVPSDQEIGNILKKEMAWTEPEKSKYTRHFDCIAEPFTNYVRDRRFGVSRRMPQLSRMILNHEITRDEALQINEDDRANSNNDNLNIILDRFDLSEKDLQDIVNIPPHVFSDKTSAGNRIFAFARGLMKGK
jgi:hypothetical protein